VNLSRVLRVADGTLVLHFEDLSVPHYPEHPEPGIVIVRASADGRVLSVEISPGALEEHPLLDTMFDEPSPESVEALRRAEQGLDARTLNCGRMARLFPLSAENPAMMDSTQLIRETRDVGAVDDSEEPPNPPTRLVQAARRYKAVMEPDNPPNVEGRDVIAETAGRFAGSGPPRSAEELRDEAERAFADEAEARRYVEAAQNELHARPTPPGANPETYRSAETLAHQLDEATVERIAAKAEELMPGDGWLDRPSRMFRGVMPRTLLDTPEGRLEVYRCLLRIEHGVFG
jgi:hypothetical protein